MSSLSGLFPPGTDICQYPSGSPPPGHASNFNDPGLKSITISFGVILTVISVTFAAGRLVANLKKLGLSDVFILLAATINVSQTVLMIKYTKYFRHLWDLPLCLLDGTYEELSYIFEILNNASLFLSKTATLLLFRQLFSVSSTMKVAIWFGVVITFVLYATSLPVLSYFAAPHAGHTWDELLAEVAGTKIVPLYYGVASGAVGLSLDIYIFVLPIPIISRLNLSKRRKRQILALFLTAIFGVAGSAVSLAYRALSIQGSNPDLTYNAAVLLNCNLIEENIALIVASTPAFASLMRKYVIQSRIFQSVASSLGLNKRGQGQSQANDPALDPNRPRTGRNATLNRFRRTKKNSDHYIEMNDSWLLKSDAQVDIQAPDHSVATDQEDVEGLRVVKTFQVSRESASAAP